MMACRLAQPVRSKSASAFGLHGNAGGRGQDSGVVVVKGDVEDQVPGRAPTARIFLAISRPAIA